MQIPTPPHGWNLTPKRAVALQRKLAARVVVEPPRSPINLVAGGDIAFSTDGSQCIAAVVVWDVYERRVVETRSAVRPLKFPYVPGLLSFREAPALLAAIRKLRTEPDAFMFDGHGLAHPRRFGLASHMGVLLDRVTIGCAKSRLIGRHTDPPTRRGSRRPLIHDGERIGTVLRTRDSVKCIYVSVGHRIDLDSAVKLTLACGNGLRLPEPTRLADRLVARLKRETTATGDTPCMSMAEDREGHPACF